MKKKLFYIVSYILFIIFSILGLLNIYRGTIQKANMTALTGKVLSKNIIRKQEHVKGGVRNSYYLVFEINNNDYKIGIFYATKKEVKNDSVINLVDIGKTYTFYMDPTYFKDDNLKNGIDIIEYNGLEIYKASLKPNLYGGLSMCIIGFILFFVTRRIRKKIIEERISSLSC